MPNRSQFRKNSRRELSAGGIVYRAGKSGAEVLLIRPAREDDKEKWTFPKGWTGDHDGESLEETALREVREEGGVEAHIVEDIGEINYIFTWAGERVFKTVHYYLMEYVSGNPADHDEEVAEARWAPLAAAGDMLSYKNEREFFAKAASRLRGPRSIA